MSYRTSDDFWTQSSECDFCSKNTSQSPPDCMCDPGFVLDGNTCAPCPVDFFCSGGFSMASQCPINTFDRGIVAARTSISSCECNPGFFRADDVNTLKIALAQNILSSLEHSNRLWCILCPMGYWCNPRDGMTDLSQNQPHTDVQKCASLSSTRFPGAHSPNQCVCVNGAYTVQNLETSDNMTTPDLCVSCLSNHYCTTHTTVPTACPRKTVSNRGSTSVTDCVCLPPMTMIPATVEDVAYDCVMTTNSLSHMDASSYVDTLQYDMYTIQADMLYSLYDTAENTKCVSIHNGEFALDSRNLQLLEIYKSTPLLSCFIIVRKWS